jgi:hypothetical protein
VAVQLTLWTPSPETVSAALALGVPRPVIAPTVAPVQLIAVMVLPPISVSLALTLPMTGELTNQPFRPLGGGKLTVTTGGVVSPLEIA